MQDSLCNWRHGAPYSLHIFFFFFVSVWTVFVWMSFTTHNTFLFFSTILCLVCPKPWHLKHCLIEGVILNSSTLKIMPVFWHISPPEISASAFFGSSLFIFINGRSLPVLFEFILSASAWVILLKSSSCLKSSSVMLLDTPLKTKILSFLASAEWYDSGSDILTFFPKTCCIFGSLKLSRQAMKSYLKITCEFRLHILPN